MTAKQKPISWYARRYTERYGFCLVPIEPGRKFPSAKDWGNTTLSDPVQAEAFYTQNPGWNMGAALGPSGLCSLDIDCEESFQTILDEFGIDPDPLWKYPTIRGSDKGRRLLFRVPDNVSLPYTKLNWKREDDPAKSYTVLEMRAACDGKQRQDVLPPSQHPDTGKPYIWLTQPPKPDESWPEPPDWLLAMWTAWDSFKPQLQAACPWVPKDVPPPAAKKRNPAPEREGDSVIQAFIDAHDLRMTLEQYGYTRKGRSRYLSPHTTTKLPGVVLFPDEQSCFIHHASDPLCSEESGQPVNAFDLFCHYDHAGDVGKAVKAAAELLGIKPQRRRVGTEGVVKDELPTPAGDDPTPPPAPGAPFRCLGYDGNSYYYLPRGTEQVSEIRRGSHTSPSELISLAPIEWWEMAYPKEKGGVDWYAAASDCMRQCERLGVYSLRYVRGRGAWFDKGASVLHLGDRLIVNGESTPIIDHHSPYIYTRQAPMESIIDSEPASEEDARRVAELFRRLNWSNSVHAHLTVGWCVLAPVCGAMPWRPHLWITAQRGAGKSWVQENMIQPMLGQSALMVQGGTTEAGIRQALQQDARPVIFDEAESEDQNAQRRMKSVLELARQASSDSSSEIVKGTVNGSGMSFRIRSMFLLGSVNVSLSQGADESRFSVVSLNRPDKTPAEVQRFKEFSREVGGLLTRERCAAIRARTYSLIPVIRQNAETMAQAVAEVLGSQRIGDQVGTLLAGAISLSRSDVISLDEARQWASAIDLSDAQEAEEVSDEVNCLNAILQTQVRFDYQRGSMQRALSEVVMAASGKKPLGDDIYADECNAILARFGLQVDGSHLLVSNTHAELKRILRDTPWAAGWRRVLSRLPGASARPSPVRFAGSLTRVVSIPVDVFL